MILSDDQNKFFKSAVLKAINDETLPLPDGLETDQVYRSEYYKYGMRGARDLRFLIKSDENGGLFLDYYFVTDDYSSHMRIDEFGKITKLENFEGQWGWPVYENDEVKTMQEHDRIKKHNQWVKDILKAKGLE